MLVGVHYYEAVPVTVEEAPTCQTCSVSYTGPWKLGRAVNLRNPHQCGQPKKDGTPCGWIITNSPCAVHLTPEDLERERKRQEEAAERARVAEHERQAQTEVRRANLITILSVTCPHCSVPAGELCQNPQGAIVRPLHQARRKLAGVLEPKEFVIEARNFYTPKVEEPPLDGDVRALLGDPLKDRTTEASARFAVEEREAAEAKVQKAHRQLWLASACRDQTVAEVPCPLCGATACSPCVVEGKELKRPHPQRVDEAMARDAMAPA